VPDTVRTITGRISYHSTGPDLGLRLPDGRMPIAKGFLLTTNPGRAPFVPVDVLRPDGTLLATGTTDAAGNYSIPVNFGQNPATAVIVRIEARLDLGGSAVRVFADEASPLPYRHQIGPAGNPANSTMVVDLIVTREAGAAAYHITDALREGFFAGHSGIGPLRDLDVYWKPGNGAISHFRAEGNRGKLTVAGGITGDLASNTDCWDPAQLTRLLGLYFLEFYYLETAPAGVANEALLVPSAAWREGFLDWWACQGRGSRTFWDTEGQESEGRIVRFYDIESFFDPALGSLGPGDPNVYQDPSLVGIGSRFTIAEMLWDIHDADPFGTDEDGVVFSFTLTSQALAKPRLGSSYPYLFTLFDQYIADLSLNAVRIDLLTRSPEDQGIAYPATEANGLRWPRQFAPDGAPGTSVAPPFTKTLTDLVDTLNPVPLNPEIGLLSQRYFLVDLSADADLAATVTTGGSLLVDILDLANTLLATGTSVADAQNLPAGRYIVRVRSASDPQSAPFDLRLDVTGP